MTVSDTARGRVHAYIGDGKGKTTTACGMLMRAAAYDRPVTMVQFLKNRKTGELLFSRSEPLIDIVQFGTEEFFVPGKSDILQFRQLCRQGLDYALKKGVGSSLLILDEVLDAVDFGLIVMDDLFPVFELCHNGTEIVLTGRRISDELVCHCDLITEMKNRLHYYDKGVQAREGIEY